MFRVLNCLTVEHNWWLVALAGLVCFVASLVAISLFHRARATAGRVRAGWLVLAGAATGCGIWATHFIAMLAYEPGVPIAYDIGLTVLSLILAAVVTGVGLTVAVQGGSGGWGRRSAAPSSAAALPACTIPACGRSTCRAVSPGRPSLSPSRSRSAWCSAARRFDGSRAQRGQASDARCRGAGHARDRLSSFHRDGRGRDRSRSDPRHHPFFAVADHAGHGGRRRGRGDPRA